MNKILPNILLICSIMFLLSTIFVVGQTQEDVAEVLELATFNETVEGYFKNKIHIVKNDVLVKSLNGELKPRGIRISNKVDLFARGIVNPVEIETLILKSKRAKVIYHIDQHRIKCILKKKKSDGEWRVVRTRFRNY